MTFSSSSDTNRKPFPKPIPDGSSVDKRAARMTADGSSAETSQRFTSPAKQPASSTSESTMTRLFPTLTTPDGSPAGGVQSPVQKARTGSTGMSSATAAGTPVSTTVSDNRLANNAPSRRVPELARRMVIDLLSLKRSGEPLRRRLAYSTASRGGPD